MQWGLSSNGSLGETTLRTIQFPIGFSQPPIVQIHGTQINDPSSNQLFVTFGNSFYGAINVISKTNFTYRGYKIGWIAIGY